MNPHHFLTLQRMASNCLGAKHDPEDITFLAMTDRELALIILGIGFTQLHGTPVLTEMATEFHSKIISIVHAQTEDTSSDS